MNNQNIILYYNRYVYLIEFITHGVVEAGEGVQLLSIRIIGKSTIHY